MTDINYSNLNKPELIRIERNSGIYAILNKYQFCMYVGLSIDIKNRLNVHFTQLRGNYHYCTKMQSDFNEYPFFFVFTILETIKQFNKSKYYFIKYLEWREAFYIEIFKEKYLLYNNNKGNQFDIKNNYEKIINYHKLMFDQRIREFNQENEKLEEL